VLALRQQLIQKYRPLAIDLNAVRLFFQKLRSIVDDEGSFWDAIETMIEIIMHEYETSQYDPVVQVMCVRGLLLLMLNEHFADYMGQAVSEKILVYFVEVLSDVAGEEQQEITDLGEHAPVIQFLSTLPTQLMHEYVM